MRGIIQQTNVDGRDRINVSPKEKQNEGGAMLYQALAGHLYRVPDGLFSLVPKSAKQSPASLVSTNSKSPSNLVHNAFVTLSREMSTY